MTDPRERQIEAMQDILILYPADLLELIAFVAEDADMGRDSLPSPIFKEED